MAKVRLVRALSSKVCACFALCVGFMSPMLFVLGISHTWASESTDAKEDFGGIRSTILETLEKTGAASLAVAVAKNGDIVWEEGFGWANREKEIKATPQTVYHLASVSKPITATGLMLLVERGLLDLDRPANDYLRESK